MVRKKLRQEILKILSKSPAVSRKDLDFSLGKEIYTITRALNDLVAENEIEKVPVETAEARGITVGDKRTILYALKTDTRKAAKISSAIKKLKLLPGRYTDTKVVQTGQGLLLRELEPLMWKAVKPQHINELLGALPSFISLIDQVQLLNMISNQIVRAKLPEDIGQAKNNLFDFINSKLDKMRRITDQEVNLLRISVTILALLEDERVMRPPKKSLFYKMVKKDISPAHLSAIFSDSSLYKYLEYFSMDLDDLQEELLVRNSELAHAVVTIKLERDSVSDRGWDIKRVYELHLIIKNRRDADPLPYVFSDVEMNSNKS